jgi:hypothetical protein
MTTEKHNPLKQTHAIRIMYTDGREPKVIKCGSSAEAMLAMQMSWRDGVKDVEVMEI